VRRSTAHAMEVGVSVARRCMWRRDTFNWRDANTASNPVAAENYLQHAEHYFRLMAVAQTEQLGARPATFEPQDVPLQKTWTIATISMACPIASALRSSKRGKPSATKPMVPPRLLRNRTRNDNAGLGVKSRRLSAVARAPASISARFPSAQRTGSGANSWPASSLRCGSCR
jgi:Domain of unknown function (DUF4167)